MATELQEDVAQVAKELQRDVEGTCAAVVSELVACDDPTHWLELLTTLAASDALPAELVERLDSELLPQVVQLLLGRAFDLSAVERVNAFYQWTLSAVVKSLQRGEIARLACLARILDAHRRFYLFHGTSNDGSALNQENEENEVERRGRFTVPDSSEYTSRYFLRNLEYWGTVGGFSALLEVLRSSASFEALQCVLRLLYDVKDHLTTEFLTLYFPELIDAVRALITSLQPGEFYALSRDSLLEVVQVMELILVKIQHDSDAAADSTDSERQVCEQRVQLLRLEISLRFFQSNSLEKRIYGLTEIVVIITRLYNEQIQEQVEPTAASLYAKLKFLVDWMHDKRLMQELLGEKMHVELVKRSTSLFQFTSELERLPSEWIDLVWSCYHAEADADAEEESRPAQRRHEAFRATIHDLLLEMATFMELPSLNHLVQRIEAVKAKLDLNQLGLLAAIAGRKLLADIPDGSPEDDNSTRRSLRQRILMHLWTVVLPSVKSENVRDEVLLRMHEMLRLEVAGDDSEALEGVKDRAMVDEFLGLCLENILRREKLATSLKLFTQLASLVVEVDIAVATPSQCNKSYVQVLLDEIVEYKQRVRLALDASKWIKMEDEERAKLLALVDHVNEIKTRLLALRGAWILDEYRQSEASSFTEEQLDNVWQLMVVDAFLLDEGALCFQWIELCMSTPLQTRAIAQEKENARPPRALMPLGIAEYLLTTKFPTLPGDCITLSTLCCFHSIFRRINLLKGGLEIFTTAVSVGDSSLVPSPTERPSSGSSSEGEKDESVELMTGQPLVGLDELWQLAVKATDSAVAEETITLLASFHLAFAPSVRDTELPFQCKMRFLEKCMEFIAAAKADAEMVRTHMLPSPLSSDQLDNADQSYSSKLAADVAVVNRCVDLLRYFLEACRVGDDSAAKEDEEKMLQKLESEGVCSTADSGDTNRKKTFRIEHLEERLPYLEIYPSPMKDPQSDPAKVGFRTGRRPSWTFRQQHALLDVIVDANDETEVEDAQKGGEDSTLPPRPASRPSEADNSPLKVDLRGELMMTESPVKTNLRSPCVRANLRWPQAPSPQRGPDLRPEDIDQALTDFTSGGLKDERNYSEKQQTRYGIMSQILANQGSHFDVLLELVDWDEATSQRTWDLLCRLPTNNELLRKMIRLRSEAKDQEAGGGQVEWAELLDGSNIHRLLYALRLVEALLIPIETDAKGNQELNSGRRQWRERFVRLGGARHLYETLLKWPLETDNSEAGDSISPQYAQNIRATCLAAVMRVLNYFFHWSRMSSLEKPQRDSLSPFDVRLQSSTLPEFVKSIELSSMLQSAVQLTEKFCSRKSESFFSEEAAEAVYCGVQMCCSLIRFAPHLTITVFESEIDNEVVDDRITLSKWLKALLVDCPSKSTRTLAFGALSEMAMAFGVMDVGSPARALYEPLVVSACFLVSENSFTGVSSFADVEELFAFCRVLLGCSARSITSSEDANEALADSLIRRRIPGRLVRNLSRIVSQRQEAAATRSIKSPRHQEEGVLGGYLMLLALLTGISEKIRTVILHCDPKCSSAHDSGGKMIQFVHNDLLFGDMSSELATPVPPICKTGITRELAQRLLLNLAFPQTSVDISSLNGDMMDLLSYLHDHQLRVLETVNAAGRQWNYAPADSFLDTEKSTHHAGLVNPGCICYMNSLVQQLFMMPSFCQGLLALDCAQIKADKSSSSWREEVEQLQKLFVSLAYTNYRASDPTAFALSHKDMDGSSTDVHIQMDADEFFSLLLDRLEMFIRPKPATKSTDTESSDDSDIDFMARCFGGVLVNQILTQQGNLSEREEKFFALSLEVSKKRHLTESLELYVQGETLEGENAYFCERVQRKVSATKRVCIKTLPQTLVCHLKRFEFDYDTMEKVKINDYLEFPTEINMFPYTSEALAATDGATASDEGGKAIMYDLVGVVVHSGTSDTGHYYSFIKDRHDTDTQRWLEFNDEVVRDFDVDTMGDECFGGEEVAQKWDALQGTYSPVVQMKRRSAYMLIYERRSAEEQSVPECEDLTLSSQVQTLATQIMQENARFETVVNAFDPIYDRFIHDLVESATRMSGQCDPRVVRQVCQLGCQFLFGISSLRCRASTSAKPSPVVTNAMTSSHYKVSARIALWLSSFDQTPDVGVEEEQIQLSKWVLSEMVASPTSLSAKPALQHAESQRTWLFDVLFLSPESPELAESCFLVLSAAVTVLAREAAEQREDAEKSLVAFFRASLNLFYCREPHLDVSDPASGCVLTLSMEMRVAAMKQLGAFLEKCVSKAIGGAGQGAKVTEARAIHRLFLEKLQFVDHLLLSLQMSCEVSEVATSSASPAVSSRGIAPLAIETRSSSPLREHDLRLCTFQLEIKLLRCMLKFHDKPVPLPVDSTLLFNHTALKNVVLFELEEIVLPILTRVIFESEAASPKCDRLVALLIGVLEEVKDTHAEKVLAVFGELLDTEEMRAETSEQAKEVWDIHRHVFSPSRGILESVAYYRDHGSHEYTLLLLEFVLRRASSSLMLQELFRNEPKFRDSATWIPQWLVDHLDSNGTIRAQMRDNIDAEDSDATSEKAQGVQEVKKLFAEVEKAFGVTVPAYSEEVTHNVDGDTGALLISPPSSPAAITTEDVLLEALDLDGENQHDSSHSVKRGSRWLEKISTDIGPEHEGAEAEAHTSPKPNWTLHRSREELSMLLRIDLDTAHNNAREA